MNISRYFKFILLVCSLLASSCKGPSEKSEGNPDIDTEERQPTGGKTVPAQFMSACQEVVCSGRIEAPPQNHALVHAPIGGFIRMVRNLPGDPVAKGQILGRLEHQDIIDLQESYLSATTKLSQLEKAYERAQILSDAQAVSLKSKEELFAEKRTLEIQKRSLAAKLNLLGINPESLDKGGELSASIPIHSPISGHITSVEVVQGQFVQPDQKLFAVVDNRNIHVALQVMAKDASKLREDQPLTFLISGDTTQREGKIFRINQSVDPEQGVVEVHAHLVGNNLVPVGAYVNARVCTGTIQEVAVPIQSLLGEGEDRWVWKKEGGKFNKQQVLVGTRLGQSVLVKKGVLVGDQIWVP